jgi:hypothetical protein
VAQGVDPEFKPQYHKKKKIICHIALKITCELGAGGSMPIILATWEQRSGGSRFEASLGQIVHETLSLKYLTQKRAGGVPQVVEYLPS